MYDSCISALDTVYARMEEDKRDLRIEELLLHKNFIVRLLLLLKLKQVCFDVT